MSRIVLSRTYVLGAQPQLPWASEMVLNPALIRDPHDGRLHMLFRATGPWSAPLIPGQPAPYPIFLGYGCSADDGATWDFDLSRPALAPTLHTQAEQIRIRNQADIEVPNYANGCIEDPRLFFLDDQCHLIVACRLFPPGPYWIHDDPVQCSPDWSQSRTNPLGRAAWGNVTVNVLYRVNLDALRQRRYDQAFGYVTHLTDPELGENRDVLLFPRRLMIAGRKQYVCIHRPTEGWHYPGGSRSLAPSMWICAAERLEDLWCQQRSQTLLASPLFDWETNRIGASAPLLDLGDGQWLLSYHGKKDAQVGYTQSFMILKENAGTLPSVIHRCPERILCASASWEMPGRFTTPCVFITGMVESGHELIVGYGAADERVGIARLHRERLLQRVRSYDDQGRTLVYKYVPEAAATAVRV